jgi:hypothetical protein
MSNIPSISGTTAVAGAADSGASESPYVQPTFDYSFRIWWAFFWPLNLILTILIIGWSFVLLRLYSAVAINSALAMKVLMTGGQFVFAYGLAFMVMFYILDKQFRHFRVALVDSADFNHPRVVARTVGRVARVWFAYSWRAIVFYVIVRIAVALPLGVLLGVFTRQPIVAKIMALLCDTAINAAVGLFIFYNNILDEQFGDARVCLLKREYDSQSTNSGSAVPATQLIGDAQHFDSGT